MEKITRIKVSFSYDIKFISFFYKLMKETAINWNYFIKTNLDLNQIQKLREVEEVPPLFWWLVNWLINLKSQV